jgi:glycosyltransferase involved in cell wall biosynthesis
MSKLIIPEGLEWEIIVVNNNCTDDTDSILTKYVEVLPIRRIFEPKQGLSNARNAAVTAARGDYIIWTDDDVLVDERWVAAYVEAFRRWPDAVVFGGKVLPWFQVDPPPWLSQNIDWLGNCYALTDFGDEGIELELGKDPFGANMALKTDAQRLFGYNPELGRKAKQMSGGEEVAVIRALRSIGGLVVWVPESVVRHFIPTERMALDYIRSYYVGQGRFNSEPFDSSKRSVFGVPLWAFKNWLISELSWRICYVFCAKSKLWLKYMIRSATIIGKICRDLSLYFKNKNIFKSHGK